MWNVPELLQLCTEGLWQQLDCDFCSFGTAYQKPTRCWLWNAGVVPCKSFKCKKIYTHSLGSFVRKYQNKPHVQLSGAGEGTFKTKLAEQYPVGFARLAVHLLGSFS